MKSNKGFTLVELLIAIVVMASVGSMIAGVIASTLRVSNKTDNIEKVRENGNHALNQMAKNIEYARSFDGLTDTGGNSSARCPFSATTDCESIMVTLSNGKHLEYKCADPAGPPGLAFTVKDMDSGIDSSIVDTSFIKMVDCSITCTMGNAKSVPIIKITFTLDQLLGSGNLVENSSPEIEFATSVVMRNYID